MNQQLAQSAHRWLLPSESRARAGKGTIFPTQLCYDSYTSNYAGARLASGGWRAQGKRGRSCFPSDNSISNTNYCRFYSALAYIGLSRFHIPDESGRQNYWQSTKFSTLAKASFMLAWDSILFRCVGLSKKSSGTIRKSASCFEAS